MGISKRKGDARILEERWNRIGKAVKDMQKDGSHVDGHRIREPRQEPKKERRETHRPPTSSEASILTVEETRKTASLQR